MNIEDVKALADIMTKNGLTALEVTEGETTVKMEKGATAAFPATAPQIATVAAGGAIMTNESLEEVAALAQNEVKSPIVGIFYAAPSPDSLPYVAIGSKVQKGDILCIVEAMKQMNEIAAETDGEIVDVCAKDGELVEFGQVIFRIG